MCVNAHVTRGACQALVFTIRNVFVCLWVNVLLRKSKVDDMNDVAALGRLATDEKVLRFHVTIDQMLRMHILHPRYLKECKIETAHTADVQNVQKFLTRQ